MGNSLRCSCAYLFVAGSLEEICFKRLSKYVLDTFYLLRFPTLGVEFLHEKNINRM